jgi:hypothetical protein
MLRSSLVGHGAVRSVAVSDVSLEPGEVEGSTIEVVVEFADSDGEQLVPAARPNVVRTSAARPRRRSRLTRHRPRLVSPITGSDESHDAKVP